MTQQLYRALASGNTFRASQTPVSYRGRFAPSPTGPLHFGSMVTALGSYLDARAHRGEWLLRIEDIDPSREQPGAANSILTTLEAYGLLWDGPVLYQHARVNAYKTAIDYLTAEGLTYPCACSRREIADSGVLGLEGTVYPGTCRNGVRGSRRATALRLRVLTDASLCVQDELQGTFCQHLANEIGDFVIRRTDGYWAYQLAVVVDDAFQGVTHVVRGADLLPSTPRQVYLQRLLKLQSPVYMHLPVAVASDGKKLSKRSARTSVTTAVRQTLFQALLFLEQRPPLALHDATPEELLKWAVDNWNPEHLRGVRIRKTTLESIA
jgi:glutamyl-Q tRNA(Asp) synthetase